MTNQTQATVEEVARIIEPWGFDMSNGDEWGTRVQCQGLAIAKARRILALPSVGWRTIDSAPRDGSDVLCYVDGLGMGQMVLYWMDGYWREKANCMGLKRAPTHWKPLPAPPQAGEDAL